LRGEAAWLWIVQAIGHSILGGTPIPWGGRRRGQAGSPTRLGLLGAGALAFGIGARRRVAAPAFAGFVGGRALVATALLRGGGTKGRIRSGV